MHNHSPEAPAKARSRPAKRRPVIREEGPNRPLVHVPLANAPGRVATLDAADFDRLRAAGVSDQWTLNGDGHGNAYVRVAMQTKGRLVSVARLVAEAPPKRIVKHRDRDRTNLRRGNLYLANGFAEGGVGQALPRSRMKEYAEINSPEFGNIISIAIHICLRLSQSHFACER